MSGDDVMTGRDALHRLDAIAVRAREEFDAAARAAESHARRRAEVARLGTEGLRALAAMRLDVLAAGTDASLSAAEQQATRLLAAHEAFLASVEQETEGAAVALADAEARRRSAEADADAALAAYDDLTAAVERDLTFDPAYQELSERFEHARSVTARASQKLELAQSDREAKRKPYEEDPLFTYLWQRRFRTSEYRGSGLTRVLDNWVAKLCRYDGAYLNYARLIELPERIAEHRAVVARAEAEAEAAVEHFEAATLDARGGAALAAAVDAAKARLRTLDEDVAAAEAAYADLRRQRETAARGDAGPRDQARRIIETALVQASVPDLRILAAETTTLDDDRIVDALMALQAEERQMEAARTVVEALPARKRALVETLEQVRRRFKESGLDSPYVLLLNGAFEAAVEAHGRAPTPDAETLWRAILTTVRQAPLHDDRYFGGRGRRDRVGLPEQMLAGMAGALVNEVLRQAMHGGGRSRRGGGGWSGGGRGGRSRSGGFGGGGFRTGGRIGGGGFRTGGKF